MRRIAEWAGERRYFLLLFSLLMLFALYPFLVRHGVALQVILSAALLSSVRAASRSRREMLWMAAFCILPLALQWTVVAGVPSLSLWFAGHLLSIGFFVIVVAAILRHLVLARRITADLIMGSACVYLLIGLIFGMLFYALEVARPGSFSGVGNEPLRSDPHALLYYSFVTITTIGYGDILPLSPLARSLASLGAILGQFYLAVLVGRLVGLHLNQNAPGAEG